jgi:hypothetical protein
MRPDRIACSWEVPDVNYDAVCTPCKGQARAARSARHPRLRTSTAATDGCASLGNTSLNLAFATRRNSFHDLGRRDHLKPAATSASEPHCCLQTFCFRAQMLQPCDLRFPQATEIDDGDVFKGGTILMMPVLPATLDKAETNLSGSSNSTAVGRNTGASSILMLEVRKPHQGHIVASAHASLLLDQCARLRHGLGVLAISDTAIARNGTPAQPDVPLW